MGTFRRVSGAARWLIAVAAAALAAACALGGTLTTPPAVETAEHLAALARWEARPFGDYRLVVQGETCYYDVLVRGGQVNASFRDSCGLQARTVAALFEMLRRDREVTPVCGARGCRCELITRVLAAYHPQLGYPTEITVVADIHPRWASLEYWDAVRTEGALPSCASASRRTLRVVLVEPIR